MALVFSVLTNIVQALNNEFSKGHRLGLKYASEFDEKLEALQGDVKTLSNWLTAHLHREYGSEYKRECITDFDKPVK
jgi:hypothetical protein